MPPTNSNVSVKNIYSCQCYETPLLSWIPLSKSPLSLRDSSVVKSNILSLSGYDIFLRSGSILIKETNFVLILVVHSLQFSEVAAATTNMTDWSRHEYDWRRRLGDGGSGDYYMPQWLHTTIDIMNYYSWCLCIQHEPISKYNNKQTIQKQLLTLMWLLRLLLGYSGGHNRNSSGKRLYSK